MFFVLKIYLRSVALRTLLCVGLITSAGCATSPPAESQQPRIEVAFSPEAGAEALVLKVIDGAHESVRVAGYSFTSPAVVKSLLAAKRRGVDVRVLIDDVGNRGAANRAAIRLITGAGIPLRVISVYAIHHDKYIVVDG